MGDHGGVARRRRGTETAADMVRSLGLVLGFVLVLLLIGPARQLILPTGSNATSIKTVDTAGAIAAARSSAGYPLLAPSGLPPSWRPTSARNGGGSALGGSGTTLHLGYVTPRRQYLDFEESDAPGFVSDQLSGGGGKTPQSLAPVEIDGTRWQQWRTATGQLALSQTAGRRSVVITGSAGLDELRTFAAALRTG